MQNIVSVQVLLLGEQATNCYVIWSKNTQEGYVIDPADEGDTISQFLLEEKIELKGILLTHGHFDHLLALLELQLNFPVPAYLHPADQFLLDRANETAAHFLGRSVDPIPTVCEPLRDGQSFPLGDQTLTVLHTPGHTPGSVCVLLPAKKSRYEIDQFNCSDDAILFTGDTLFSYGIEPLTHQYSRPIALSESLDRLSSLEGTVRILPGHGETALLTDALKNYSKNTH